MIDLLQTIVTQVTALVAKGLALDQVRKEVDLEPLRKAFAGMDPVLNDVWQESIVTALIERADLYARGTI